MNDKESKRANVINELVETEKTLAEQLKNFINAIVIPIREEKIISSEQQRTLFSNIETIAMVSEEIAIKLSEISEKETNQQNFGEYIEKIIPLLKCYSIYCSVIYQQEDLMKQLMNNKQFTYFIKLAYDNNKNNLGKVKLDGYLIKPMQRITKYPLLLRELISATEKDHPDFQNLENSYGIKKKRKRKRNLIYSNFFFFFIFLSFFYHFIFFLFFFIILFIFYFLNFFLIQSFYFV